VIDALDDARITSISGEPGFQHARGMIDLVDGPFEQVMLVVDLDTTCFPFESWEDNPPPAGENWPADCDAFDRNFEILLDEPENEGDAPALELVRAITPFGGPLHIEQDITDVANGLPGAHSLHVRITTWSDSAGIVSGSNGGWNVSARVEVTPGAAPRNVLAVVPVFNGSVTPDGEPASGAVDVPEGTTASRFEYRVTGHGGGDPGVGCIGPAEEFCQRSHVIFVDDVDVDFTGAWRDDCDTLCTVDHYGDDVTGFDYCAENPTGNMDSVRAPRANWCPGSVTPPFEWDFDSLRVPGSHELRAEVSLILPGGSWRTSMTYFAYGGSESLGERP
jgi:hypothetical protein